jgi:hypothetical protein
MNAAAAFRAETRGFVPNVGTPADNVWWPPISERFEQAGEESPGAAGIRRGWAWSQAARHSALMPAALTTSPLFSVSSAISLPNSAGVSERKVPPRSPVSRPFSAASASAALTSRRRRLGRHQPVDRARLVARHDIGDHGQIRQAGKARHRNPRIRRREGEGAPACRASRNGFQTAIPTPCSLCAGGAA